MAIADFFHKNIQAASLVLNNFDANAFRAILEREVVGIAFDEKAIASVEGANTLDLLVRLLARFYPNIFLCPIANRSPEVAIALSELAKSINPKISLQKSAEKVSRWIVVGSTKLKRPKSSGKTIMYVGSDNWLAKLSKSGPVGSERSKNPFGAGAAACFAVANLFRAVFSNQLPGSTLDANVLFSALDFSIGDCQENPKLKECDLDDLHLIGAGAVGNGFLWAVSRLNVTGRLHVVDGEKLDASNLQRYVMATPKDVGQNKVDIAKKWLHGGKIDMRSHRANWEDYLGERLNWSFERVAVAVDSAKARINIQAALPRTIFNSWTQGGEVGLSRHSFVDESACLACLYLPTAKAPNFDEIVLEALRLPNDEANLREVRTRLDTGIPTDRAFLERISGASNISVDRLSAFEGLPLAKFYSEAVCGGAVLEFSLERHTATAEVPMAFQSALAGILLAADAVAEISKLRRRLPTITQIDLLRPVPLIPSSPRKKQPDLHCICSDLDFLARYREKYSSRVRKRRSPESKETRSQSRDANLSV